MSVKVFSKDGKPDRVVSTASQETAAVFEGFREVKAEADADKQKAPEQLPVADLVEKAKAQDADTEPDVKAALAKANAPKPAAPKTN